MDDKLFAALVAAAAALLTGLLSYLAAKLKIQADLSSQTKEIEAALKLQEERLRTELRTEFMAEEAIRELLLSAQPKRSFEVIERRVGGFDGDELRQLLVRAGAVRFYGRNDKELWGLRERNELDLEGDG
ncbi:hypothetical protein [Streptomyces beigongshangae]|uniref:hypothetical protein n=1 Tax=Streptomyces beigongshangae TaxID=2841597 RepID=UPI001C84BB9F|nr:hypothetical protein [Streptomyces sp. REN17]